MALAISQRFIELKFADHADEKGMISYYLVDPDQDSSKYQKLGEIAESKI